MNNIYHLVAVVALVLTFYFVISYFKAEIARVGKLAKENNSSNIACFWSKNGHIAYMLDKEDAEMFIYKTHVPFDLATAAFDGLVLLDGKNKTEYLEERIASLEKCHEHYPNYLASTTDVLSIKKGLLDMRADLDLLIESLGMEKVEIPHSEKFVKKGKK